MINNSLQNILSERKPFFMVLRCTQGIVMRMLHAFIISLKAFVIESDG
jgi:hypothetical protein